MVTDGLVTKYGNRQIDLKWWSLHTVYKQQIMLYTWN